MWFFLLLHPQELLLLSTGDSPHISCTKSKGESKNEPENVKELSKVVREWAQQQWKQEMSRTQGRAVNNTKESQWSKRANIWQDACLLSSPQNPKLKIEFLTIPSASPNSTGVGQRYEGRPWSISLMETEKTISLYFPLKKKRKCPLVTPTFALNWATGLSRIKENTTTFTRTTAKQEKTS